MKNPILEVKHLWFRYKKNLPFVLQDISFSVQENDVLGITGPNGSGKTTLVKHLNGLLTPERGEILFEGNKVNRKTLVRSIGLVFQNPDEQVFYPVVKEDIEFGPRNMKLSEKEIAQRVNYALETLKIKHLATRKYVTLSFGEKKKVAIAGVLAMKPRVLILDEPTIGLDPWSKQSFLKELFQLKQESTIIIISHDFDLLKKIDKIILLHRGRVVKQFVDYKKFLQATETLNI